MYVVISMILIILMRREIQGRKEEDKGERQMPKEAIASNCMMPWIPRLVKRRYRNPKDATQTKLLEDGDGKVLTDDKKNPRDVETLL